MALTESQASRRQKLLGMTMGALCGAALAVCFLAGVFDSLDQRLADLWFRLRGERSAGDEIAIVAIDDATIRAYGTWPLPRDQYALLLDAIAGAGALAIGVDLQLPEDKNHDPKNNAVLAYVSSERANIVHAISFLAEAASPSQPVSRSSLEALRRHGIVNSANNVPVASGVLLPFPDLTESSAALAHITVALDRDGVVRRQPLLVRYEDRIYPSMALRMLGIGSGHQELPWIVQTRHGLRVGWDTGPSWRLPLDAEGATALDFAGDRAAFPNTVSMIDVLREHRDGNYERVRERFDGRYVFIGLDAPQEAVEDAGSTPFAATTPLVLAHANAIENLLRGRFLWRSPAWVYPPVLLAMATAFGLLVVSLSVTTAAIVTGSLVLALAVLDFVLLAGFAWTVPPLALFFMPPVTYAAVTSTRYLLLEKWSRAREIDIREGRSVQQQFLPEALVGQDLSRYRIVAKLGRGGMGIVYRGTDPHLGRDVAIKVLPGRSLADERARRRFRREALALSKLEHQYIARVYDFDTQDGTDFIVMELVSGTPLATCIRGGPLLESEAIHIAFQVAEALVEAHTHGVIHRDLKPENIMLTDRGGVKVLDFGLAIFLDSGSDSTVSASLTEAGYFVGTLPYIAPEILSRRIKTDPRSDLYSLGVILFEMATGKRPFPDDHPHELVYTIVHQAPPEPRILNGKISLALQAIILRLLAKTPEERFASAADLRDSLRALGSPTSDLRLPAAARRLEKPRE